MNVNTWERHFSAKINFSAVIFVPYRDVEDCFVGDLMSLFPDYNKLKTYCDYLRSTYISEESTIFSFI